MRALCVISRGSKGRNLVCHWRWVLDTRALRNDAETESSYFYLTPLRHLFPVIFYRRLCCSAPGCGACSQDCKPLKIRPGSCIDVKLVRFHRWHQSPVTWRWDSKSWVIMILFIRWQLCNCRSCWMHLGWKRSYACNFWVPLIFNTYNVL